MRRVLLIAGIVGVLVAAGLYASRVPLALRLVTRAAESALGESLLDRLPDGLHVALCGAGSPLADPARSGPCVDVIAGCRLFVIDSGSGGSRNLSRMRIPQGRIEAILLTHFHSDHIDGLGELMMQRWLNGGHRTPVPVYGPPGVQDVVAGFNRAYRRDSGYRVAHHGDATVPASGAGGVAYPFSNPVPGRDVVVLEGEGLVVRAFRVTHAPVEPAVGYRIEYGGRSVVLSGDTVRDANLVRSAQGVDLLVHEALSPELVRAINEGTRKAGRANLEKITADILDYHTSPREAAEIAREVGARHLLFYHVVPPLILSLLESAFLDGVDDAYSGGVTLGRDGTLVRMPARSDAIEVEQLL